MEISQGKKFEKPDAGMFLGTIIDVVDMPNVQTAYGLKNRVRIQWALSTLQGQPLIQKDGLPLTVVGMWNANLSQKAELTKKLQQILGTFAVPLITSTEQLAQLVLGRSNLLVLVKVQNPKDPNDPYTNVDGIGPIPQGMGPAPGVPVGFVREINRPKTMAGPNGQPVATYAQPPAATPQYAPQPYVPPAVPGYVPPAAPPAAYAPAPQAVPTVDLNKPTRAF